MEDEQRDFAFTAEFEVRPEVKLTKVEGLKVKKEKFEMREELVDATLEDIRKRQATMVPVLENRPAQMSDTAVVDFKGFVDGQPLENGAGENHPLELGSNSFIPGFEEGIVGMSVGATKRIQLKFPDEYHAKDIAGKQVEFEVTVKELKKKSLPEATDEFVKGLGPYESVAALRTVIREDFEKRETKRVNDDMRNRLMKALVDANPVEVPQSLLKDQKKTLIEDFEKRMSQQNMSPAEFEDYKQKWDGDFTETASYMIQSSFLIDKIAGDQNLRATPADVEAKLQEYAQQTGLELAQIKEFYNDDDRRSRIAYQCTEEKVLTYLMSKATVVEVSKEDLAKEDVRGN
jgi:trigger factor